MTTPDVAIPEGRIPIAEITRGRDVLFQVPWETPEGNTLRLVLSREGHPFELLFGRLQVQEMWPHFALLNPELWSSPPNEMLKASHEDFRGLVTAADPARPGETIHTYLYGLGPVTPEVATGEKSPDPPALIRAEPRCFFQQRDFRDTIPATVPFAGLMPGFIGVYQMDVTLPPGLSPQHRFLFCQFINSAGLVSASGEVEVRVD